MPKKSENLKKKKTEKSPKNPILLLQSDIMMEALLEKERELQRLNAELDEKQRKMAAAATSPSPRKKVGDTSR